MIITKISCDVPFKYALQHQWTLQQGTSLEFWKVNCITPKNYEFDQKCHKHRPTHAGADPGFLERGFICIKVWGLTLLILSHFFLNIPWKWNNLVSLRPKYFIFIGYLKTMVLTETKLFHFHMIFENGGQGGGFEWTPLNPFSIRHCHGTMRKRHQNTYSHTHMKARLQLK